MLDRQWDQAISAAALDARKATVFVEHREHLRIASSSGEEPEVRRTLWSGGAVDLGASGYRYHSDLAPEDLELLLLGNAPPPKVRPAAAAAPILDADPAFGAVAGVVVEAKRRVPGGTFHADWIQSDQQILFADAENTATDRRRSCRLRLDGSLAKGGREARASAERVVNARNPPISELVECLIERLEARLSAREPDPGPSTVVFAPSVGGIWIHEVIGHAAEADRVQRGASWLSDCAASFDPALDVIDDPRRGRAPWRYDDEGVPARPVALIRAGRPRDLLHSRRTARRERIEPSGHARRSSFREALLPRMGCTFIANGDRRPEEILRSVSRGIYVRRMESASADTATGRAVFRVTDADMIQDGGLGAPLVQHLLETLAPQGLAAIDGIGDDLAFDHCIGLCHRDGQPLSTSVGAPTICTRLMTVRC